MIMKSAQGVTIWTVLCCGRLAVAALSTFDSLPEDMYRPVIVDGGITFYAADAHLSIPYSGTLVVDDASATMPHVPEWQAFFTSPNVLTMTVLCPGPEMGSPRFGEVKMSTGQTENLASIDVFVSDWGMASNFAIVLDAYYMGSLVATDSVPLGLQQTRCETLTVSGVDFDTLRLTASGPDPATAYFMGAIDNVLITPEPSPAIVLLVLLASWSAYGPTRKPPPSP